MCINITMTSFGLEFNSITGNQTVIFAHTSTTQLEQNFVAISLLDSSESTMKFPLC